PHLHGESVGHALGRDSPVPDLRVLDAIRARGLRDVPGPQGAECPGRRGRGSRIHAVPLQQHASGAVLAPDPHLRRLLLAPGRLDGGTALKGFWTSAVTVAPSGKSPITFVWYQDFLNTLLANHAWSWFAYVITFG